MSQIKVIDLWPPTSACYLCYKRISLEFYLPMHEGQVVRYPARHEWAGCPVCKDCYDRYEINWRK